MDCNRRAASTGMTEIVDDTVAAASHNSSTEGNTASNENAPFLEKEQLQEEEGLLPNDRWKLVYFIILLQGIGTLLPWNTFLTIAKDYFIDFKLENANGTEYQQNFFSYLGVCSQIPNLLLNFLNLFIVANGAGLVRRIFGSLIFIIVVCLFTIIMIFVPSNTWPFTFFLITMISVVALNSANGVYQNSIYGLMADFPFTYTNAVILGSNLCGIFVSVLAILMLLFVQDIQLAATIYFGIALLTVVFCAVTFHLLSKNSFYRYYVKKAARAREQKRNSLLNTSDASAESQKVPPGGEDDDIAQRLPLSAYISILKEAWQPLFNVFIVFFVTLALFPAVLVKIQVGEQIDGYIEILGIKIQADLFTALAVFLNFNVFATLGNFIANFVQWPSPKYLTYAVVPRLLFIPIFLFCNYIPANNRVFPVLISGEWNYIVLISLMSITHGYYSSLSMMYAPKVVEPSKSGTVGMMSAFFLILGITIGIIFTFVESIIFSA
ncbi:nucleoside transporter domain-containing protein [Ditylenchus destructor]|uniref:Nucleoside transporter domain-containing protein n=1 Tax=Ditylenchus destructor TaxID=166010 RepID=A0AAD4N886_9BILA|nr:nucleoside transporter domain-containing protein [Ditylenchus destructor]